MKSSRVKNIRSKRRVSKNYNSAIIEIFKERPVVFNPALGRLGKSAVAGLFLSQLLYWWEKGSDRKWIYKTIEEIKSETCLTRSEQDRSIKVWLELKVLEVQLRGLPRRRFFSIDFKKLTEALEKDLTSGQVSYSANQIAEIDRLVSKSQQAITESTSESTYRTPCLQQGSHPRVTAGGFKSLGDLFGNEDKTKRP